MKSIICTFTLILISINCYAAYKEDCTIKYGNSGKSYQVSCTYATGSELNTSTNSFKYDSFGLYSVVFWAQGQATIIKIRGINFCGHDASQNCADNIFPLQGNDQEGREWKVCQPSHMFC